MAQIDLKNATIRIKDGYSKAAAVNNSGGYGAGNTTMLMDGFTGLVHNFDLFTVAGDTVEHQVTAHSETLGNTTSITFTPALGASVVDNAVITFLPHELEVKIGEGNLSWEETKNRQYYRDRGRLDTVRDGDEEPVDVRMDATWEFLKASSGGEPTIEDVLKKRGEASHWVTSSADTCEPYAVDIEIEYIPPCEDEQKEVITLADFRYEKFGHDLRQGQLAMTGKCNITEPTIVREDQ